jgi:MFS superfamily sulfate permease-like transporter
MFRRGIFLKTSVAIRSLSRESYVTYMNVLGVLFILAGIVVVLLGALGPR